MQRPQKADAEPTAMPATRKILSAGLLALAASLSGCDSGSGFDARITLPSFAPIDPAIDVLTPADIDVIIEAAAVATDDPSLVIAVVDRLGNLLRLWNRTPGSALSDNDNAIATSLARTAAYLSHSQAPLTSRTGQFISTFHYPAVFGDLVPDPSGRLQPSQQTVGINSTPLGPLWQIDASNRGAVLAAPEGTVIAGLATYDTGKSVPPAINPDGTAPTPGFTALPGGVPLYKTTSAARTSPAGTFSVGRRLVGAIGVYSLDANNEPQFDLAEFAAVSGSLAVNPAFPADIYTFSNQAPGQPGAVPPRGGVFLVGVLLPFIGDPNRFANIPPGIYNPALAVFDSGSSGAVDPFGWLISPTSSTSAVPFSATEVQTVVEACVQASFATHAAIRLPSDSPCSMIIAVTDVTGQILGAFRMEDATLFSLEISVTKARNAFYYSDATSIDATGPNAGRHPLADIVPPGTAVTARTLGFLSTALYPPSIEGNQPGPLFPLALENRRPNNFDKMGFAPAVPPNQSGVIFFPGSAPLYRDGVLIGGIGVSGDGVAQAAFVTAEGIKAAQQALLFQLEPDPSIRCDNFSVRGVALPYYKFPQNPRG